MEVVVGNSAMPVAIAAASASFIVMGIAAVGVIVGVVVVVSLSLLVVVGVNGGAAAENWDIVVVACWLWGGPIHTASTPCPSHRPGS